MSSNISFYNDSAYIRVVNSTTGVDVRVTKANLVIQKDSANTFFFKNDDYISYFNYGDIATPASTSITDLINQIADWNTSFNSNLTVTSTTEFSTTMLDSLSRLKVSGAPDTTLNLITLYDKNAPKIDEITLSNATSTHNSYKGTVSMTLTDTPLSKIIRQSKLYPSHVHGSTSTAIVAGALTNNSNNSNVVSRIGVFDDSANVTVADSQKTGNGIFFKYDTNGLKLVYRTNVSGAQSNHEVPQAQWNLDPLNGNGTSGVNINITTLNNYVFEWNAVNPAMPARAGVYARRTDDGKDTIVWCHRFSSNVGFFGNPCLPVRWEIGHDSNLGATPDPTTMVQGSATVYSDEISFGPSKVHSKDNGAAFTLMTSNFTLPMFSLRLAPAYNRAKITAKQLQVVNIAQGGTARWALVQNASLSNASFVGVGNGSFAQYSSNENWISGGTEVAAGYIYGAGVQEIDLGNRDISLLSKIDGTQDTLTLAIQNLYGTVNVNAGIEWREQE